MKLFIASLATETNTFAAFPTGRASFEEQGIYRGDGSLVAPDGTGAFLRDIRALAEADGHAVVESVSAWAQPAGTTIGHVYEDLRDAILEDLRAAMPVDVVQLFLHGAMVAQGYDDCEGDLLARVREIVGPGIAVGAELDLHCHFTERMRAAADAIVCFKEYPHIDARERAGELYRILVATAEGRVRPRTAMFDCRMVGLYHTTREPMASFVRRMQALEGQGGILSISLGHGFPWGDVADNGARLWVIADGDMEQAGRVADMLGREFWEMRRETDMRAIEMGVDAAIDRALAAPGGPVVMADSGDNPGGGAAGDSTFILRRLAERGIGDVAIGPIWDVGAVHVCTAAGEGATLDLRVGGKCGPASGDPIDLRVTVRRVAGAHSQSTPDGHAAMGPSVWVRTDQGIDLLINSIRNQAFGRDLFTGMGISLDDKRIVVVKSAQHFHADFASIAREVLYVATPAALVSDFARIPFVKRNLDYWPRVEFPAGMEAR